MMSQKSAKSHCKICGKSVGIFGFECRCKNMYCTKHRIPELHECTYNFKQNGKQLLESTLIKVTKNKIENI